MSEESSTGAPGTAAPEGEPASRPEEPQTRRRRWLSRLRRTSLPVRIAAAVVAVVVVAVVVVVPPSSPPPDYTSLPAPCALVSKAVLDAYLPNPVGTPISAPPVSFYKSGSCKWSSTAGGQDRIVSSDVILFGSSSAIGEARQFYSGALSILGCHCPGTAVSTRSVTGLGDQATALFVTAGPDAADAQKLAADIAMIRDVLADLPR